jgi:hypothetical protein
MSLPTFKRAGTLSSSRFRLTGYAVSIRAVAPGSIKGKARDAGSLERMILEKTDRFSGWTMRAFLQHVG